MNYFKFKKLNPEEKDECVELMSEWFRQVAVPNYNLVQAVHFSPEFFYKRRLNEPRAGFATELSKKEKALCRLDMIEFLVDSCIYNDAGPEIKEYCYELLHSYRLLVLSKKFKEDHAVNESGYHVFKGVNAQMATLSNNIFIHLHEHAKKHLK